MSEPNLLEKLGLSVEKHFDSIADAAHDVIQTSYVAYVLSEPPGVVAWVLPWRRVGLAWRRHRYLRALDRAMKELARLTVGTLIAVGQDRTWQGAHPAETKLLLACCDFTQGEKFTTDERLDALVAGHDNYRAFRAEHNATVTNWPKASGERLSDR